MPIPGDPAQDRQAEQSVREKFEQTAEFRLWKEFVDAARKLAHDEAFLVEIPAGFLHLAGDDLQNNPFFFPALFRPWNRLIDELGLPAYLKKGLPPGFWTPEQKSRLPKNPAQKQMDEIYRRFETCDEYLLWQSFIQAVQSSGGAPAALVPTAFLRLAGRTLGRDQFHFRVLRLAWNRVCDEMGLPHLKKGTYGN
jgi:hypothetical protein